MDIEKRKFIRHPLQYPLKTKVIDPEGQDTIVHSNSDNIGEGGLLFSSSKAIPLDSEVHMALKVEGREFSLDGIVVRCENSEDGSYNIAISFNKHDEALKARMMEQVVQIEQFKDRLEKRYNVNCDFAWVAKEWIKRYARFFTKWYGS
ncbi:MAG: PilZ domain-containing protein [Spirochaetota bacterium]|nr:MAG: PilZ domain-containing protein [Spirochaetota bacterium]